MNNIIRGDFLKFNKFDVTVERLGGIEIFSYDGYILGFRDLSESGVVSFCPIIINNENMDTLDSYFEFVDTFYAYNGNDYISNYNVYVKDYNKTYGNLSEVEIIDLISDNFEDSIWGEPLCDIYIEPQNSFKLIDVIHCLVSHILYLNEDFVFSSSEGGGCSTESLALSKDDYIEITVNYFEQYAFTFNSTTEEMDDVVSIFKHFFEMLDKNLNRK